jgi:23S rRNA (pseudouridine1915-N3)-methyltransferase
MQIHLIAVGNRMPVWVKQGFETYARRLPKECELLLKEIVPGQRGKNNDIAKIISLESEKIRMAIPSHAHIVVLDVKGKYLSTMDLAKKLKQWLAGGENIAMIIGGPDGISDALKENADELLSLSALTFPHPIVRIIMAEQLYRAWSIIHNHPYHRE